MLGVSSYSPNHSDVSRAENTSQLVQLKSGQLRLNLNHHSDYSEQFTKQIRKPILRLRLNLKIPDENESQPHPWGRGG